MYVAAPLPTVKGYFALVSFRAGEYFSTASMKGLTVAFILTAPAVRMPFPSTFLPYTF